MLRVTDLIAVEGVQVACVLEGQSRKMDESLLQGLEKNSRGLDVLFVCMFLFCFVIFGVMRGFALTSGSVVHTELIFLKSIHSVSI